MAANLQNPTYDIVLLGAKGVGKSALVCKRKLSDAEVIAENCCDVMAVPFPR